MADSTTAFATSSSTAASAAARQGWLAKKKRGTIFFNKYGAKTFWVLESGRLSEYSSFGDHNHQPQQQDTQTADGDNSSSHSSNGAATPARPPAALLLQFYETSAMTQVLKERSDELLIVFRDDSTVTMRAADGTVRDAWFLALSSCVFRPPAKSNLSVFRRATLTLTGGGASSSSSTGVTSPTINAAARLSKRTSIASHKERMSAHFSRAQLLAKQINKKNDDSLMRKRGSKEPTATAAAAQVLQRVMVVPSIANEERVDASRFVKTAQQTALLLEAINRDLLPVAASVFATAHVSAEAVVDLMFSVRIEDERDIIVQGEASDRMYVIERGQCGVYSKDFADVPPQFEIMKRQGESFGLLALLYTQPAPFTIRSELPAPCTLWALPRNSFFNLNRDLTRRNHAHKLMLLMTSLQDSLEAVFDVLSVNTLEQIADSMEFATYRLGQVIVHEGDLMNKIFIVDEGEVQGEDISLSHGDVFGAECLRGDSEVQAAMTLLADSDEVVVLTINAEEVRYFFGQQQEEGEEAPSPSEKKPSSSAMPADHAPLPPANIPPTPKKRTKGTILHPAPKKTLKKFTSASGGPRDTANSTNTSGLLAVFVDEVEDPNGVRVNLDIPFEKNVPRLRPDITDVDHFTFKSHLGRGQFGTVHLVELKATTAAPQTPEQFALKVLQGNVITLNGWEEMVQQERDAMLELAHNDSLFLCRLFSYFSDRKNIYFVLEYVDSGTLQEHMEQQRVEASAVFQTLPVMQFYLAGVVLGLAAIHAHDICYRDLKPENMMMSSTGYCKLADFGLAKKTRRTFTFCGSPQFMAPETLLNRGHGLAVDWWASGIFLFEMLCGYTPFAAFETSDTFEKVLAYNDNPTPAYLGYPKQVAGSAESSVVVTRTMIENLLFPKQNKRLGVRHPGVRGIKQHAFFQGFDWDAMEQQQLPAPFLPPPPKPPVAAAAGSSKPYDPNLFAIPDDMTGWTRKF